MLISARVIKHPRKQRRCENCEKWMNGEQVRLYGAAEKQDPPYVIYVHPECCANSPDVQEKLVK
jgi:hypothetical protein